MNHIKSGQEQVCISGTGPHLVSALEKAPLRTRFLIPTAISQGSCLRFAAPIVLLVVSCGYQILHDAKDFARRASERFQSSMQT